MPDDFVLNVRQIGNYQPYDIAPANAMLLLQVGGLGGPYGRISPQDLVATAMQGGGVMVAKSASVVEFSAQCLNARQIAADAVAAGTLTVGALPVATVDQVNALNLQLSTALAAQIGGLNASFNRQLQALAARPYVASVNQRSGPIVLSVDDVSGAAPLFSPLFGGQPMGPTPHPFAAGLELVNAEWVWGAVRSAAAVSSINGRTGAVWLNSLDILAAGGAPQFSPQLKGAPTAPTPGQADFSDRLATTKWVMRVLDDYTATGLGLPGPPGPPGPALNFKGDVADNPGLLAITGQKPGDVWHQTDTAENWVWSGVDWVPLSVSGIPGPDGPQGPPGTNIHVATTMPAITQDGELWFNTTDGDLYASLSGVWVAVVGQGIQGSVGPQGPPGPVGDVSVGASAPAAPQNGDFWYDDVGGALYIWLTAHGQWIGV